MNWHNSECFGYGTTYGISMESSNNNRVPNMRFITNFESKN